MKRTISHLCPECFQLFQFSYQLPILTKHGAERTLAGAVLFELELAGHHLDHANERIQLFLDEEKRDGEFVRDEAKRAEYIDHD